MSLKRFVLKTGFNFAKMLELEPAAARRMFYLNLFVPVAYEMISVAEQNTFAVLLLSIDGDGKWEPVFSLEYNEVADYSSTGKTLTGGLGRGFDQSYFKHYERITGEVLDSDLQSKAFKHAFYDCVATPKSPTSFDDQCPVLASMSKCKVDNIGSTVTTLSVLTKLVGRAPANYNIMESRAACREAALSSSDIFGGRIFNKLTGEWVGLCDPTDESCCESCRKIYESPQAENFYSTSIA